jgi:hypothetical protein
MLVQIIVKIAAIEGRMPIRVPTTVVTDNRSKTFFAPSSTWVICTSNAYELAGDGCWGLWQLQEIASFGLLTERKTIYGAWLFHQKG